MEEKKEGDILVVAFMSKSGNKFFWPTPEDKQEVTIAGLMCVTKPPYPVSQRHYQIEKKEMEKIKKIFSNV